MTSIVVSRSRRANTSQGRRFQKYVHGDSCGGVREHVVDVLLRAEAFLYEQLHNRRDLPHTHIGDDRFSDEYDFVLGPRLSSVKWLHSALNFNSQNLSHMAE